MGNCLEATLKHRMLIKIRKTPTCWLWTGATNGTGYGEIGRGRTMQAAHRAAFELFVGPIPEGAHILHQCDNPLCVNPAHLSVGTRSDNMRDMMRKGRGPDRNGTHNGSAKLNETAIKLIRSSPLSLRELAEIFGTGLRAISSVRARETWKHV